MVRQEIFLSTKLIESQTSKPPKSTHPYIHSSVDNNQISFCTSTFLHQQFEDIDFFDTGSPLYLTCFVICAVQCMSLLMARSPLALLPRNGSEKIGNEVDKPANHWVTRLCSKLILHFLNWHSPSGTLSSNNPMHLQRIKLMRSKIICVLFS